MTAIKPTRTISLRQIAQTLGLDALLLPDDARQTAVRSMHNEGFITARDTAKALPDEQLGWVHLSDGRAFLVDRVKRGVARFQGSDVEAAIRAAVLSPQGLGRLTQSGLAVISATHQQLILGAFNVGVAELMNQDWLLLTGSTQPKGARR